MQINWQKGMMGDALANRLTAIRELVQSLPQNDAMQEIASARQHGWTIETQVVDEQIVVEAIEPPNYECAMMGHDWEAAISDDDDITAHCTRCELTLPILDRQSYTEIFYS